MDVGLQLDTLERIHCQVADAIEARSKFCSNVYVPKFGFRRYLSLEKWSK
jgi:hypothetical protein